MTAPALQGNVNAHMPETADIEWYRIGADVSVGGDDFWWNTTLADGCATACPEPDGWEGLTYILPVDVSGGRDGGLPGPGSVAPRQLVVDGGIVAPSRAALANRIRALRALLGPRKTVIWDAYDHGLGIRVGVACAVEGKMAVTKIGRGVAARLGFTLTAANPVWKFATDGGDLPLELFLPTGSVTGRTYNYTYNYNYGAVTNPGGFGVAVNRGELPAWPQLEIRGPVGSPIILNETTGEQFQIVQSIPAGDANKVTIDARTGVVTPASYTLIGRPFALQPGANTIRWRATSGTFDANARLIVSWLSVWE